MNYRQKIDSQLSCEGVESMTAKLTINDGEKEHDLYVKVGWYRGRPVWIDVTIARHANEGSYDTINVHDSALPLIVSLRRRMLDNTRAFLEIACREASILLSSRRCSLDELASLWRATEADPRGRCEQVSDDLGSSVHGPLDAVAKLLRMKEGSWSEKMAYEYSEAEIETMIEDCQGAIETRPDEFTKFEITFIEGVAESNETIHLSKSQIDKLEQIWEDRNCG